MKHQRLFIFAACCLVAAIAIGFVSRAGTAGTRAAQDPQSEQAPLIQRPNLPPTPTRAALPNSPNGAAPAGTVLFQQRFAAADPASIQSTWAAADLAALQHDDAPARWGLYNGLLSQLWTGDHQTPRPDPTIVLTGPAAWRDYTLRAAAYPEGNMELGLVVRRQGASFYRLRLLNDALESKPKLLLEKVIDGRATVLASQDGPGYQLYRWYNLRLSVVGNQLEAQVDNGPVLRASDSSLSQGQAGLYALALGQLGFDNVTVTAP